MKSYDFKNNYVIFMFGSYLRLVVENCATKSILYYKNVQHDFKVFNLENKLRIFSSKF